MSNHKNTNTPQYEVYCYACICINCNGRDVYVGKAKRGLACRHYKHVKRAKAILEGRVHKNDLRFDHFMSKHGITNLVIRSLGSFSSENEMNLMEIKFIDELKTFCTYGGLNYDKGGRGGRIAGFSLDPERAKEYGERLQSAYAAWRRNNPDLVKARGRKIVENRERSTWLAALLEGLTKSTPEERSARSKAGWQTRRNKKLEQGI